MVGIKDLLIKVAMERCDMQNIRENGFLVE